MPRTSLLISLDAKMVHPILQVRVFRPAPKLAKKLPVGVQLATPAPQVLAGTYRKALGTAAPTADALAGIITSAMNDRSVSRLPAGLLLPLLAVMPGSPPGFQSSANACLQETLKWLLRRKALPQIFLGSPLLGQPFPRSPANMHWLKTGSQEVNKTSQQAMRATDLQLLGSIFLATCSE